MRASRAGRLTVRCVAGFVVVAGLCVGAIGAVYLNWPSKHLLALSRQGGELGEWAQLVLDWRYAKERARAECRRQQIEAELAGLRDHPWAGVYGADDGGDELFISPASGFVLFYHCDVGTKLEGYGDVACATGDKIELRPGMMYPDLFSRAYADRELVRIAWAQRRYLISQRALEDLRRERLGFSEIRTWFMLRAGDEVYPVCGWPGLPEEYRPCWPPPPPCIGVTLASVTMLKSPYTDMYRFQISASLDAGWNEGLAPGTGLVGLFGDLPEANVAESYETCSIAEYETWVRDGKTLIVPQPGWLFADPAEPALGQTGE